MQKVRKNGQLLTVFSLEPSPLWTMEPGLSGKTSSRENTVSLEKMCFFCCHRIPGAGKQVLQGRQSLEHSNENIELSELRLQVSAGNSPFIFPSC